MFFPTGNSMYGLECCWIKTSSRRCATGGEGDRGHMGDRGKGETGDTGLTRSTILRHDIKPKMDETVKSKSQKV